METDCPESEDDDVVMLPVSSYRKRKMVLFSSSDDDNESIPEQPIKKKSKKVNPQNKGSSSSKRDPESFQRNPLDQTTIHPESYHVAERIIEELKFTPEQIGCDELRSKCAAILKSESQLESYCNKLTGLETIRYIVESLSRPLDFDIRQNHFGPLFRDCLRSTADLHINMPVIGRVINVTTFGAFVDIGLEVSAFIHVSKFPKLTQSNSVSNYREETLKLGDVIHALIEALKDNGKVSLKQISLVKDHREINDFITSSAIKLEVQKTEPYSFNKPQSSSVHRPIIKTEPYSFNKPQPSSVHRPIIKTEPYSFNKAQKSLQRPVIKTQQSVHRPVIKTEPYSFNKVGNAAHLTSLIDLIIGDKVTGVVSNLLDYAAFVNIGSECDAFVHISQLPLLKNGVPGDKSHGALKVGDRVEALIDNVKVDSRKIWLKRLKILA